MQLPVSNSIQESIDSFLRPEELSGNNEYLCNVCSALKPAVLEHEFSKMGDFLIIQLKRFRNLHGSVTKNIQSVKCNQQVQLPVLVGNNTVCNKTFKLIASVNHSGSLERGHYTASINTSSVWFHCNDAAVIQSSKGVSGELYYIFFYKAV